MWTRFNAIVKAKMRRHLKALTEGFVSSDVLIDVHTVLSSQRVEDWLIACCLAEWGWC